MSEELETDLTAASGGQPEESPSGAAREYTLGDGMMEGNDSEDLPEAEGQPEKAKPEVHDTDPEEKDRGYLRHQDYTRKTEELAQMRRDFEAQRAEFQRLQQEALNYRQVPQQAQQPATMAGRIQAIVQQAQQSMADPNLTAEQKMAIQSEIQGLTVIGEMASALEDLRGKFGQWEPKFNQYGEILNSFTAKQAQEVMGLAKAQKDEAVEKLGEEVYQAYGDTIRRNFFRDGVIHPQNWEPPVDPLSGKSLTMAEFLSRVSGRQLQVTEKQRDANGRFVKEAKQKAARGGTDTVTSDRSFMSREEALANW